MVGQENLRMGVQDYPIPVALNTMKNTGVHILKTMLCCY